MQLHEIQNKFFCFLFHNAVSWIRSYNPSFVYSSMDLLRNRDCVVDWSN
jgi:hypothetical protein